MRADLSGLDVAAIAGVGVGVAVFTLACAEEPATEIFEVITPLSAPPTEARTGVTANRDAAGRRVVATRAFEGTKTNLPVLASRTHFPTTPFSSIGSKLERSALLAKPFRLTANCAWAAVAEFPSAAELPVNPLLLNVGLACAELAAT